MHRSLRTPVTARSRPCRVRSVRLVEVPWRSPRKKSAVVPLARRLSTERRRPPMLPSAITVSPGTLSNARLRRAALTASTNPADRWVPLTLELSEVPDLVKPALIARDAFGLARPAARRRGSTSPRAPARHDRPAARGRWAPVLRPGRRLQFVVVSQSERVATPCPANPHDERSGGRRVRRPPCGRLVVRLRGWETSWSTCGSARDGG